MGRAPSAGARRTSAARLLALPLQPARGQVDRQRACGDSSGCLHQIRARQPRGLPRELVRLERVRERVDASRLERPEPLVRVVNTLVSGTCKYSLTGDPWWVRNGVQQYYNMQATILARYKQSTGGDPVYYTLYGRFNIRYDGTYTRRCWYTGSIIYPYVTACAAGGILSGR